jgi:hypothetical protein
MRIAMTMFDSAASAHASIPILNQLGLFFLRMVPVELSNDCLPL